MNSTSVTTIPNETVTAASGTDAFVSSQSAPVVSNGTSNTSSLVATAPSVSPELAVVKQSGSLAPGNPYNPALISKLVDALTSVVSALVTLVNTLVRSRADYPQMPIVQGSPTNTVNSPAPINPPNVTQLPGTPIVRSALDINKNDAGMITVRTLDGFTVRAEGRDQAWSITGPDGKSTRIWGDPHVTESDGDKWDFINRSTFMFGKNKATVEVVPAGNGQSYSARLNIYSDYERVTIDGIDKNQPNVVAASSDGLQHDASLADGEIYKRVLTPKGEAWISIATGKVVSGG